MLNINNKYLMKAQNIDYKSIFKVNNSFAKFEDKFILSLR